MSVACFSLTLFNLDLSTLHYHPGFHFFLPTSFVDSSDLVMFAHVVPRFQHALDMEWPDLILNLYVDSMPVVLRSNLHIRACPSYLNPSNSELNLLQFNYHPSC
jgi:hypothetical protein